LECIAIGTPTPQYEWKKDGRLLGNPSNIYRIAEGTIHIKPLTSLDEGHYQCIATNQFGTALSRITVLQRAVLSPYGPGIAIFESPKIQEGQPYTLNCNPTKCVPKATYSWAVAKTTIDDTQFPVILSKRVQIDDEGRLHFSYVTMADAQDNKLYKCNMYNPYLDLTMGGSYSKLNVVPVATRPPTSPSYLFSSPSPMIALERRNVTLRCFFSGNPDPSLQWSKVIGSLPLGRHQITNYNTELTIRDVQKSDEGDYYCKASNPQKHQDHLIQMQVQAAPVFREISDKPHNLNTTEGSTITISCNAHAEPLTDIVWLRNGVKLNPAKMPAKYRLLDGNKKLEIRDLCKDCEDGSSDLAVIQCNASNIHGYAFSDGYINVLQKTLIIERPSDISMSHDDTTPAVFPCTATSDDSTPVTVRWYRVRRERDGGTQRVDNVTNKVLLGDDGSLVITLAENSSDWAVYKGTYKCVANNSYSSDEAVVNLYIDDPVVPGGAIVAGASIGDWWWLFLLIALLLLLLILLICCCICLQRNKGDTYPVDQKERKNGNNPEKELADSGFHDYRRPDGEPLKGSRVSLSSSMKLESDDEASLNEYGDIDAGKFTEDGSFIGDYGTDRRQANNFHV